MDRKSVTVLLVCFLLLMLWHPLINYIFPPTPLPDDPAPISAPGEPVPPRDPFSPDPPPILAPRPGQLPIVRPDAPEELVTIEDEVARYTFTSHGGGVKLVELKNYPATVDCRPRREPIGDWASLNTRAPVPAMSLLGAEMEEDGVYHLTRISDPRTGRPAGVRAEKTLSSGLQITKEFLLSTNHLLRTQIHLVNPTDGLLAIPAHEWVIGTSTPIGQRDETFMMGFEWFNGTRTERLGESYFANRTLGCFPGQPRYQYNAGASNVVWAAVHNQFFTMIALPSQPAPQIMGRRVDLPPPTEEAMAADSRIMAHPVGYQAGFLYPATVLQPGGALERQYNIYAGPKEYYTLSRLGHDFDRVMDFGGPFGFFAKGLLLSMNGIHAIGASYGVAIIIITIIIKLLFWPLTNASTKSMKRMAALQPQMKALQEKYKDDPKKMNMKLMEFMKQNKVNPLGGCLPMLLQIPVFIGFYKMLQSAIELRGASFLWTCDLSQPDTIAVLPGLGFPINLMPLLMGATMLWQARMMPIAPGMDPVQQKIMRYMPLMFMVFLYNFSAGLTLYWTMQNLLTILQMKVTKTHEPLPAPPQPAGAASSKPGPAPKQHPSKKKKT